ncbi:LytR/AlgR family response regulator transcription factor [Permianibacter aggregans]|uniref:LytTR family two component transcriptional regulator n=1 Tax=Permianibacter aggregans TaxID=1510150 RepID=A0A4R6UGU3_9GAMM|nr:LytTR family DNA-binding domain-containing protein [Permianibacter aggregans]QGX39222.1 response regulator transcription factor [Permianibacter aggregans]TDQ46028.1 LytTR family two component transcriptional regulator [Permianibacter aggregans]
MRVLIVDDETPARMNLRRHLLAFPEMSIVGEAEDGAGALQQIAEQRPDVVLCDIQMPGISGLEVAAACPMQPPPLFVFVTAFDAHALRAFDLNAVDYLLKPFDANRFAQMIGKLKVQLGSREAVQRSQQISNWVYAEPPRLLLPDEQGLVPVAITEIIRVEAAKDWVALVLPERQVILRKTLSATEALLGEQFMQVHRSHLVRIDAIEKLEELGKGDYLLHLANGETIRMSRRFAEEVLNRLGQF